MVDMSQFIAAKSDQINADDLIAGPRTITITRVTGNEGNAEQPVNVFFEGDDGKPFRPCKSMRRVMVSVWGANAAEYVGKSMTIYRDPKVKWGGMEVGGIRISHMSGIDEKRTMSLTATRAKRAPYTVMPLKDAPPPPTEDKAAKWAEGFKADIAATSDTASLAEVHEAGKKALDKLAKGRSDLHEACIAALNSRRGELAEGDDVFEGAE